MARVCQFCQRTSLKAKSRSHSNIGTIRRQKVNLQKRWIDGVRILLCTSCLKTLKGKRPELFAPKTKKTPVAKHKKTTKKKQENIESGSPRLPSRG